MTLLAQDWELWTALEALIKGAFAGVALSDTFGW